MPPVFLLSYPVHSNFLSSLHSPFYRAPPSSILLSTHAPNRPIASIYLLFSPASIHHPPSYRAPLSSTLAPIVLPRPSIFHPRPHPPSYYINLSVFHPRPPSALLSRPFHLPSAPRPTIHRYMVVARRLPHRARRRVRLPLPDSGGFYSTPQSGKEPGWAPGGCRERNPAPLVERARATPWGSPNTILLGTEAEGPALGVTGALLDTENVTLLGLIGAKGPHYGRECSYPPSVSNTMCGPTQTVLTLFVSSLRTQPDLEPSQCPCETRATVYEKHDHCVEQFDFMRVGTLGHGSHCRPKYMF